MLIDREKCRLYYGINAERSLNMDILVTIFEIGLVLFLISGFAIGFKRLWRIWNAAIRKGFDWVERKLHLQEGE